MSSVKVTGNPSGTGVFEIAAPGASTDRTQSLPDATGTFVLDTATQTLTNKTLTSPTLTTPSIDSAQFATVSGTAPIYGCRAWVNFNGTGTTGTNQTIRASGNVTNVFKNSTGDYTVNFTTALPDANFAVLMSSKGADDAVITSGNNPRPTAYSSATTSSVRIFTATLAATLADAANISVAIFR